MREQHPLLLQQAVLPGWQVLSCSLPALRLPALLEMPGHACSLGTDTVVPLLLAGMLLSSGRALFSTPVPCALSQRAGEVWQQRPHYFFGCPFTVSDPIPTIPWSPRDSSCHLHAAFLCRLFFIWVLGERRTEEVHEPQQTTSHFYFPYCRVLYRACRVLIKPRSPRNVSAFCISTTTFLHVTGNTKLECTFAMC